MFLEQSKHWGYVRAVQGLVSILRDPDDLQSVFLITNGLRETTAFRRMVAQAKADPAIARMMADRHLAPPADLEALARLPEGSLGQAFAANMLRLGLTVEFYPKQAVVDDLTWIEMRLKQTHDIWHVVTGFGTTPAEELGLQALGMAQLAAPLGTALIGGALLRSLVAQARVGLETELVMDAVTRGWQMGRAARPLLAQRWEEGWDRPLADWRRELGIRLAN